MRFAGRHPPRICSRVAYISFLFRCSPNPVFKTTPAVLTASVLGTDEKRQESFSPRIDSYPMVGREAQFGVELLGVGAFCSLYGQRATAFSGFIDYRRK